MIVRAASVAVAGFLLPSSPVTAQAPRSESLTAPVRVNGDTQVGSIGFTFLDHRSFPRERLGEQLALRAPGTFEFLPFHTSGPFPFTPLELQRDLARLRRFYERQGFPHPVLDYGVRFDEDENRISIQFLVREGDPRLRGALTAVRQDGTDPTDALPEDMRSAWRTFLSRLSPREGERIGEMERSSLEDQVSGWLRERGYPFAGATAELEGDSASAAAPADVTVRLQFGPRSRVGQVTVSGMQELSEGVVRREMGITPGDWYSAGRLSEGERELHGLDLVRVALADPVRGAESDSTVDVRVRIEENLLRVVSGQLGFATESGVVGQADWAHRNFMGGARTFSVSLQARTGALAIGSDVQRRYALSTSLKQPYFFGRKRSLVVTPQVQYRDDFRDRSWQFGSEAVVVQQWSPLRTASVSLAASRRQVLDFRVTGADGFDFRNVLVGLDTLDHDIRSATLGVSFSWGHLDDAVAPRRGYLYRASSEVTGPSWLSSAQYGRVEASVARFVPFSERTGLILRFAGGRLFPYGSSVPTADGHKTEALLRLRDALFTAGGRYDVRGWGEQLLGPKFPDVRLEATSPDTVLVAERYAPIGGLARVLASVEVRLPLPGAGPKHSTHVFFDSGRVWSPDERFQVPGIGEGQLRYSVGTGVELGTPVGLFRVSVGYKLNPSLFDVRDPQAVFAALSAGTPVADVPVEGRRRWHLHVAIGQVY